MSQNLGSEEVNLPGRSRPQYHYFYGSTDDNGGNTTDATAEQQEQDSLIGEGLVPTDHEEETPNSSERDLQHLIITNGGGGTKLNSNNHRPIANGLGRILVIIGLAAAMVFLLVLLFPHTSETLPPAQSTFIPFPSVDRSDYGDPVEGFIKMEYFHPSLLSTTEPRKFIFPFPTGAFWTNLIVDSPDPIFSYPIAVYPYAYKWSDSTLQLSYPSDHRHTDSHSIRDSFAPELSFSTSEQIQQRYVTRFDPLSVTLRFSTESESRWESILVQGSPYVTLKYVDATPIIRALSIFKAVQCPGSDDDNFSDFTYYDDDDDYSAYDDDISEDGEDDDNFETTEGGRRKLFGVCSIDDSRRDKIEMRGVQFILKTNEGLSWIMFSSEPIDLIFDNIRKTTVYSSNQFTGIIRLALIPASTAAPVSDSVQTTSSTGLRRLIYHAGVYPIGGDVSWEFRTTSAASSNGKKKTSAFNTTNRVATVKFNFATRTMTDSSHRPNAAANGLLMLALPHHAKLLSKKFLLSKKQFDREYHCIKGTLKPVVGSVWSYDEPLLEVGFDGGLHGWDPNVRKKILDQVGEDITRVLPTRAENVYGFGKQVARLAQLAHITKRLQTDKSKAQPNDDEAGGLFKQASELLWYHLEMFLSGEVVDGLLYDSNLGGLVSTNGLYDKGEDFGNGRYNDHHFHYGYILYASAIMANINSTFIDRFGTHVDAIFRDVAHYSNGDSRGVAGNSVFFPLSRHKSWFDGHSFATGMFSFGNGKSQESSSEAVNCYYGAYLWSLVRHEASGLSDITDFTRLLLAMEIRGAKTYWHMMPSEGNKTSHSVNVYTDKFRTNYMVGNVGMLDVECNTWFGSDPLYIHMINALPITGATAALFDADYVSKEYPYLMGSRNEVEMAWRGYVYSIHAIIDPNEAWKEAEGIVSYELDSALSKSQVLYWISNRPGFNVSLPDDENSSDIPNDEGSSSGESPTDSSSSSCESHNGCSGLTGYCCPTQDGKFLACCNTR